MLKTPLKTAKTPLKMLKTPLKMLKNPRRAEVLHEKCSFFMCFYFFEALTVLVLSASPPRNKKVPVWSSFFVSFTLISPLFTSKCPF